MCVCVNVCMGVCVCAFLSLSLSLSLWGGVCFGCMIQNNKGKHESRIFSPPLLECEFSTLHLRIEVDGVGLDYYAEFDSVQLVR